MSRGTRPGALSDAAARRRATTVFDRNFVVVAGAGTGKTALLVERVLNHVAGTSTPMSEIAAITFTEKAAAKLREDLARSLDELRVLARDLAKTTEIAADTEARRAYAWLVREAHVEASVIEARALAALLDLDIASVGTLHAFCADILRRRPREAGVDPAFAVDEGPFFQSLFAEEWERFLAEELGARAPRAAIWRRALRVPGALGALFALGAALASFRLPAEATGGDAYQPPSARTLLGDEAQVLLSAIAGIRGRARGLNPNMELLLDLAARYIEAFLETGPGGMAAVEGAWTLEEFIEKTMPVPGKKLLGLPPEEVTETATGARGLIKVLARVDEETVAALVEAALPVARRARERLLAAGFVSYDGLLRLARDLLARDPAIRREIGARHRAILVDEFQDTDPVQSEILFFLSEQDGLQASDAYATRLAPGRLFIVGDPKQSIYRFRGADIEAYCKAVDHITACGGEVLTLDNSFRSPDEIVGPINALFESYIGARGTDEQPEYRPIVSARGPAGDASPLVEIWSVPAPGDAEERRRGEGEAIAAWIAANLGRAEASGRPLECRNVALLFRSWANVDLYAQALRRTGLPFVVDGGKNFYERPEVGDLLAFLRAAANPNDRAALLAVLRGPLGGVPDPELAGFAAAGGRLDLTAVADVDTARFPGLRRTIALVESFRATLPGRSPDEIIRQAIRDTPLLILHAALFEGAQRVANLRKLVARAEDLARRGLSLEESLRALEDEFQESRDEGESPLADETVDAVRILSVHKAKGLEFDVVFVPDVGRESPHGRRDDLAVAWVPRDGGHLGIRLAVGTTNLAWVRHERYLRRHEEAEEKRVFYVACTRARQRLVLVNSNTTRRAPWRDALRALGYSVDAGVPPDGPLLDGRVAHRRIPPPAAPAPVSREPLDDRWREAARRFAEAAAAAAATTPPLRSPASADAAERPRPHDLEDSGENASTLRPRSTGGAARETARLAGSAVHIALQQWSFEDSGGLRDLARRAAERIFAEEFGDAAPGKLLRNVLSETDGIVEEFLRSPLPARLAGVRIMGREIPLLFKDEAGVTWTGTCDLLYRDERGRVVVADYKTERVDGEPGPAAERHRRQLEIYVDACRRALPGETVRGEILFVRAGISVGI